MSRVIVSNAQVLTAGTKFDQDQAKDGKPVPSTVVTLLVTPSDAERIALASTEGSIMLALRNPLDSAPTETKGTRLASLMGAPEPPPVVKVSRGVPRAVPPPPPPPAPRRSTRSKPFAPPSASPRWSNDRPRLPCATAVAVCLSRCSLHLRRCRHSRTGSSRSRPDAAERVLLTAGRSTVVTTDFDITRIAVTNPLIADAVVVRPREVLVDGKASGTVSLIIWGGDTRKHYDVVVDAGVSLLQQNFQDLFRGEDINVSVTENSVILSGSVSNNDVMLRAAEIARAAFPKSSIVNMLQLPGGSPSNQVMLQVRFAEVNRNAFLQAGLNLFAAHDSFAARSTTQQFAAPDFDSEKPEPARVHRLPEPVLLSSRRPASAAC